MTAHPELTAQPAQAGAHSAAQPLRTSGEQRWAAAGLIAATALAAAAALGGPLNGALQESYSSLVEDAAAAQVPVRTIDLAGHQLNVYPLTVDGLEITAFVALLALRPTAHLRTWIWVLLLGSFVISLAGNGVEPAWVRSYPLLAFSIKAVPALSAAGSAHLLLLMAYRVIALVRTLLAPVAAADTSVRTPRAVRLRRRRRAPGARQRRALRPSRRALRTAQKPPAPPASQRTRRAPDAAHPAVLEALRNGRGYRTVMKATRWGRPRAEEALRAARESAQAAQPEVLTAQPDALSTFRGAPGGTGQEVAA